MVEDERRRHLGLRRGGHDPQKVYAAFHAANEHKGQPTVLLVKTVKGFGMGKAGEGKNTVHQTKKLTDEDIKYIPRPLQHPDPDSELPEIPFYKPADDTPEMRTCTSAARPWAATCRTAAPRPTRASPCRRWRPSRP
jgi:pyruvate dehydrogenase complex dehydrogenase (E1) component